MEIPLALNKFLTENYSLSPEIDIGFELFKFSSPERLIEFQIGYRWHGLTKERLNQWNQDWIVFGNSNADPLIYNTSSGEVLFDRHGSGKWNPRLLFSNLEEMRQCLLSMSEIVTSAGENLLDDQLSIRSEYVQAIKNIIFDVIGQEKGNLVIHALEIREYSD